MLVEAFNNTFIPGRKGNWDLLEKGQQHSVMSGEGKISQCSQAKKVIRDKAVPESPMTTHGDSPGWIVRCLLCTKTGRRPSNSKTNGAYHSLGVSRHQ